MNQTDIFINQKHFIRMGEDPDTDGRLLTIKEFISSLPENEYGKDLLLSEIVLDGTAVAREDEARALAALLGHFQRVELTFRAPLEVVHDSLKMASQYIDEIQAEIRAIIECYGLGQIHQGECLFIEFVDHINLFLQLFHHSMEILGQKRVQMNDEQIDKIALANVSLMKSLKALIPAKEKRDIVLITDIMEYEIAAHLEHWKTNVVPIFLNSLVE